MHLVREIGSCEIARCRLGSTDQVTMMLTQHGYRPVLPRQEGSSRFIYPYPVASPFDGGGYIGPFYDNEKKYLDEITAAFEVEHGVPPENTWYYLFWDGMRKISGVNIIASCRVSLLEPAP